MVTADSQRPQQGVSPQQFIQDFQPTGYRTPARLRGAGADRSVRKSESGGPVNLFCSDGGHNLSHISSLTALGMIGFQSLELLCPLYSSRMVVSPT